tara:strand:- start:671 stop:1735 length:1065 start_codon:yes stop_codon:yes gene_type:complete
MVVIPAWSLSSDSGGTQNSAYGASATDPSHCTAHTLSTDTYLVTGGAGFIGSHLVEHLLRRGASVRVVDSFITGRRENLAGLADAGGLELLEGDLADPTVASRAVAGMTYVLHQAAIPSVPRSVSDPWTSHRANVDATLHLLIAARDAGVRRVVYAASSSAYGDTPTLPKVEAMPTSPRSPYGLQKLVGEQYAEQFTRLYGLETVSLRYFNIFGPRQDPNSPYSGVIARFVPALLAGERPTIYGDGEQTRDFTYIDNAVAAVLAACTAPKASGAVINVATGERTSLNDLLARLSAIVGVSLEPVHEPARTGDVRDSLADCTKARELLNYSPSVSLDEGLRRTVDWYRQASSGGR